MARAVIGLGSNLGSREAFLRAALADLDAHPSVRVLARSRPYRTAAVGPPQPDYLNAAAAVESELPPRALLDVLLGVERRLGRVRDVRWGPRTVDLDLLWHADGRVELPDLVVPHPRLMERPFALAPLLEVFPERDEYREALARVGGAPPAGAWCEPTRDGQTIEVRACDDADALALALNAWLGDWGGGPAREVTEPDARALAARVAREGAARVLVSRLDPGHLEAIVMGRGAPRRAFEVELGGARARMWPKLL